MTCEHDTKLLDRFWSKVDKKAPNDCWGWVASKTKLGYGRFWFDGGVRYSHRVVWGLTHGPIPDGLCVLHHCDNRQCVNPAHLFLGTQADNVADRDAKGRASKGVGHSSSKLTEPDVLRIREAALFGATHRALAQVYNVNCSTITHAVNRKTWAHI